ncbi:protein argonaute 2-like [Typha angustifolia]|uniref:protein argonaute 2-like n=1 Tax=Typha angustifolia TaxID=59011 RepID=UPI003C2EAF1D
MRRPDRGGSSCARTLDLSVNHFLITYNEKAVILHYLIHIKPRTLAKTEKIYEVSRFEKLSIKNELFRTHQKKFPPSSIAYDGESNLFGAVRLPTGEFEVDLRGRKFVVGIEFKKKIELSHLRDRSIPGELLQGLNVIVREDSRKQKIACRRNIYSTNRAFELGRGITALLGLQQTLASTETGPELRVNYSITPFLNPGPVLQFLNERLGLPFDEMTQLTESERSAVKEALNGLQVTVTHRRSKEKFTALGLTSLVTEKIVFRDDRLDKEVNLVDYYKNRYLIEIKFRRLPCLDLSKNQMNFVPMEFCELVEGQRYPRDRLRWEEERALRQVASVHPMRRKKMIIEMVHAKDGPCRGELAKKFKIGITSDMTQVTGRVLECPNLRLKNLRGKFYKFRSQDGDCQWNLMKNKLLEGQKLEHWAILDFSAKPSNSSQRRLDTSFFTENLVERLRHHGIQINKEPAFVQESSMAALSSYRRLYGELKKAKQTPNGHPIQLLICAMAGRHPGYKSLKLICETELGIMTQCCISYQANDRAKKDKYLGNLALKINAKLGGTNVELYDPLPRMSDRPFMLIGADVNHPPCRNTTSPSIAAVVATVNYPQPHKYISRVRCQKHRVEQILELGEMCKELVERYAGINGVRPEKIVYFRDGVSDGQFDMVLNKELKDLKSSIETDQYSPTITVVVAQKRHHTRLFPFLKDVSVSGQRRSKNGIGNVPPGTVVDTGIVDPLAFNFYLCSHFGSLGASKPTHYYVLHDEHGFTSDEMQKLIYDLCFTFARCTKPVSLVPPVYYADLVAYRGRLYFEGLSTRRLTSFDHAVLPQLHERVENGMFYA